MTLHRAVVVLLNFVMLLLSAPNGVTGPTPSSPGSWMEKLGSADANERGRAACELGEMGSPAGAAVTGLVKLLGDDTPLAPGSGCGHFVFRSDSVDPAGTTPGKEAAYALAAFGDTAVPQLVTALVSPGATTRR
ncbi:MAG TPA: hypothetical protein VE404_00320, partial [Verrucomicrobiae bacterium]|nr:hypothetical protein [Verrucomicrobiae bacterium]